MPSFVVRHQATVRQVFAIADALRVSSNHFASKCHSRQKRVGAYFDIPLPLLVVRQHDLLPLLVADLGILLQMRPDEIERLTAELLS